jgi:hypothetical protein
LLYLAVQVRQNTAALRAGSRQEIVSGFRDFNRLLFQPGVNHAALVGMRLYPQLPAEEKGLFGNLTNDFALFFQGAFSLHEAGTLEEETYLAYLQIFAAWITTPGGSAWWAEMSPLYTPRMVAAVNARVAQGGLPDLLQFDTFREPPAA